MLMDARNVHLRNISFKYNRVIYEINIFILIDARTINVSVGSLFAMVRMTVVMLPMSSLAKNVPPIHSDVKKTKNVFRVNFYAMVSTMKMVV